MSANPPKPSATDPVAPETQSAANPAYKEPSSSSPLLSALKQTPPGEPADRPKPSNSPSAIVAAAAAEAASKVFERKGSVTIRPVGHSVHPLLRPAMPSSGPPAMSLATIAAAAKSGPPPMTQGITPDGAKWGPRGPPSTHGGPQGPGGGPPPPYSSMPPLRHASVPSSLSIIRKQEPFGPSGPMPILSEHQALRHPSPGDGSKPGPHSSKSSKGHSSPSKGTAPGNPPSSVPQSTAGGPPPMRHMAGPAGGSPRPSAPSPSSAGHHPSNPSVTTAIAGAKHPVGGIPSSHASGYPPHFTDHYSGHPPYPGYSPRAHGPPRHPPPLHSGPPSMYGGHMPPHPGYGPQAHHSGVLRGPHDMYRSPHPAGSPGHPHLLMKGFPPGMESLAYPRSPRHPFPHHQSPIPGKPQRGGKRGPHPPFRHEKGDFGARGVQ